MTSTALPKCPKGTCASGRRLWRDVQAFVSDAGLVLDEREEAVLREIVRTVDLLDLLDHLVATDGPMVEGKVHPAVVEARLQRVTLVRLLASLRLPEEATGRPQRRGAARGAYGARRSYGALALAAR